jgi:hypothetical protein
MKIIKFLSREKLVEYLDEELRLFLNDQEIYEINQYGWLIDDRPDPEYIGLAMWQTEPPIRHDKILNIAPTPPSRSTSPADMSKLFTLGLEFEELMKSARHSIGLTCLYHKETDGISQFPGYHFSDAAMKLRLATDRIRDFFIDAFENLHGCGLEATPLSPPPGRRRQQHLFCHPFKQIRTRLAENPDYYEELLDCLDEMLPLIEQTSLYRIAAARNNAKFPAGGLPPITDCDIAEEADPGEEHEPALAIESITHKITEWYKLLIKTSNKVFLAEYLLRNSDNPPPVARIVLSQ